jgi:hypothetical protein
LVPVAGPQIRRNTKKNPQRAEQNIPAIGIFRQESPDIRTGINLACSKPGAPPLAPRSVANSMRLPLLGMAKVTPHLGLLSGIRPTTILPDGLPARGPARVSTAAGRSSAVRGRGCPPDTGQPPPRLIAHPSDDAEDSSGRLLRGHHVLCTDDHRGPAGQRAGRARDRSAL